MSFAPSKPTKQKITIGGVLGVMLSAVIFKYVPEFSAIADILLPLGMGAMGLGTDFAAKADTAQPQ